MTDTIAGIEIVDVTEQSEWLKLLVYGWPGVGKTRLLGALASLERFQPVLWIDIEKGTRSIRDQKGISVVRVANDVSTSTGKITKSAWSKMQEIYNELERDCKYKTIVVDNLSECERMSMDHTMAKLWMQNADRAAKQDGTPDKREWGKSNDQVTSMVRAFRDIEANVFFSAHVREITNDSGVVTQSLPGLPGKPAFNVAGMIDLVVYMYIKEVGNESKRYLLTKPSSKYPVKDRSDKLPNPYEVPPVAELSEAMSRFADIYMEELNA